jgi:DNA polymerase-3 subunit delta'
MQFQNIVGNDQLKGELIRLVEDGRIPHATLFEGVQGSGALPMAHAWIQYIYCEDRKANDSCGACPSCLKISQLVHADLILTYPVVPLKSESKPTSEEFINEFRAHYTEHPYTSGADWIRSLTKDSENKQGNITAHEISILHQKLSLYSVEGGVKILFIWLPEYLGKEGNKLLKVIEEPPEDTLFVLVTEEIDSILPTILSRTQLIQMEPIKIEEIRDALKARGVEDSAAVQMARLAEGNFHKALALMDEEPNDHYEILRGWFNILFTQNGIEQSNWVEAIQQINRQGQRQFIEYLLDIMERLLRSKYLPADQLLLTTQESSLINKLVERKISDDQISEICKELTDAHYKIGRNVNGKILFTALSIRIKRILAGKSLYLS